MVAIACVGVLICFAVVNCCNRLAHREEIVDWDEVGDADTDTEAEADADGEHGVGGVGEGVGEFMMAMILLYPYDRPLQYVPLPPLSLSLLSLCLVFFSLFRIFRHNSLGPRSTKKKTKPTNSTLLDSTLHCSTHQPSQTHTIRHSSTKLTRHIRKTVQFNHILVPFHSLLISASPNVLSS